MTSHYQHYYWKGGKPYGRSPLSSPVGTTFKIPADPYFKRISIEKYIEGVFTAVIYDSALFDFRHLTPLHQTAWQKVLIKETEEHAVCHIFNQDDRLVMIEEYQFKNQLCCECRATTPHGVFISLQKVYYEAFKDPFNGVILFDQQGQIVMAKKYQIDSQTGDFSEVKEEFWDHSSPIKELEFIRN